MNETHIPNIPLGEEEHEWDYKGAKPLTKELVEYLKELGVVEFEVHWEGGSDEGYFHAAISHIEETKLDGKPSKELTEI